jgi:3'-phosphoadenosine 5'-phosphosulfate sulfotransferase (PAPS reductase)/FAD synthetase
MIQLTDHMNFNKKEGPSEDTLIPLRRGNKTVSGDRESEESRREGENERKKQQDQVWGRQERSLEGQENE